MDGAWIFDFDIYVPVKMHFLNTLSFELRFFVFQGNVRVQLLIRVRGREYFMFDVKYKTYLKLILKKDPPTLLGVYYFVVFVALNM